MSSVCYCCYLRYARLARIISAPAWIWVVAHRRTDNHTRVSSHSHTSQLKLRQFGSRNPGVPAGRVDDTGGRAVVAGPGPTDPDCVQRPSERRGETGLRWPQLRWNRKWSVSPSSQITTTHTGSRSLGPKPRKSAIFGPSTTTILLAGSPSMVLAGFWAVPPPWSW